MMCQNVLHNAWKQFITICGNVLHNVALLQNEYTSLFHFGLLLQLSCFM